MKVRRRAAVRPAWLRMTCSRESHALFPSQEIGAPASRRVGRGSLERSSPLRHLTKPTSVLMFNIHRRFTVLKPAGPGPWVEGNPHEPRGVQFNKLQG